MSLWLGRLDDTGSVFIITGAAPGDTVSKGGITLTEPLGVALVNAVTDPVGHVNGLPVDASGRLCVDFGGTFFNSWMGLPRTVTGRLKVQLNQPESPGDAFVSGVRVGPLGGIYVTDLTPPLPVSGFSDGFSTGFGA